MFKNVNQFWRLFEDIIQQVVYLSHGFGPAVIILNYVFNNNNNNLFEGSGSMCKNYLAAEICIQKEMDKQRS